MEKVVVLTGAGSGLGKKFVEYFEKDGFSCFCLDLKKDETNAKSFACDVSDENNVIAVFEEIAKQTDHIDILINCAGYGTFGATELISTKEAKKHFDVNYFGSLYTIKAALPLMQKNSKIFNIASASAYFVVPFRTHYAAVKAAVMQLSVGLRMELINSGIYVSCFCPGDIKTNFNKNRVVLLETNQRYGNRIQDCYNQIDARENKRMSLDSAAKQMYKKMKTKKPKAIYVVKAEIKLLKFASRFVSQNTIISLTNKKFK